MQYFTISQVPSIEHHLTPEASEVMSTQQFCLKWNNYQSNMSDVFLSMLNNENMVDVTLACDGQNIKAHKMVLAACSPYFQTLFQTNPCKHPIVILKDVRFLDLRAIIDFMYRGEVNVGQDQLAALLKTAETLKGMSATHTPVFTGFFLYLLSCLCHISLMSTDVSLVFLFTLSLCSLLIVTCIHYLAVKGLAEVTEKQARGQVTSQHQQPLFGTAVAFQPDKHFTPNSSNEEEERKRNQQKQGEMIRNIIVLIQVKSGRWWKCSQKDFRRNQRIQTQCYSKNDYCETGCKSCWADGILENPWTVYGDCRGNWWY